MEDYVNTYLKRLYPAGKQTMRVGVLLGSVEQYEGMPYIFVDGAMEMEDVELDGEKVMIPESSWKKVYAGDFFSPAYTFYLFDTLLICNSEKIAYG